MPGYTDTELWLLLVLLVGVTLLARGFFLVLPQRWQPRGAVERALRAAPLAALVAITLPEILAGTMLSGSAPRAGWLLDPRLLAAAVLAATWAATRHGVAALVAGSVAYLVLLAVAG
jgi:branched-subunit amino acid transport protein